MPLVSLVIYLIIFGLILYVVRMLPIDAWLKNLIYVVLVIVLLLWLIGLLGYSPVIPLHR